MKRMLLPVILMACYAYAIPSQPRTGLIKGKLVYTSCASIVVQVLDSSYFHLTQDKWQRTPTTPTLSHVFMVKNSCSFPSRTIDQGATFSFKIIQNAGNNDGCVLCTMYDHPPTARLAIEVIE